MFTIVCLQDMTELRATAKVMCLIVLFKHIEGGQIFATSNCDFRDIDFKPVIKKQRTQNI